MKEYIIIKVDRHESRKTGAYTRWVFSGEAKMLYSTYDCRRTHWFEYWYVEKGSIARRYRRTNLGNVHVHEYPVEMFKISPVEEKYLREILKPGGE